MKQSYVTVLVNDLPTSVVRTKSFAQAISITAWLSGSTATIEKAPIGSRSKRRGPVRQHFRCRPSSVSEIALFQHRNLEWQDAQLVAVML